MQISLKEMLKAGVHFGHQPRMWNPKMRPYIFGKRSGIYIIDLHKSAKKFVEALAFIQRATSEGKTILFTTTKLQAIPIVEETAKACKFPYMIRRWLGGFITNFKMMKKRTKYLINLEERFARGEMEKYTKKERLEFGKELDRLTRMLGGVKYLDSIPDVVVVADVIRDHLAIKEATKMGIPVVAIVDVDGDPSIVTYPIPANDDATGSLKYIFGKFAEAIAEGRKGLQKQAVMPVKQERPKKTNMEDELLGGKDDEIEIRVTEVDAEKENMEEELVSK